ncbi:conjugal transfer protein [Tetragenococcus halophilus]
MKLNLEKLKNIFHFEKKTAKKTEEDEGSKTDQTDKEESKRKVSFSKRRYRQMIVYGGWTLLICSLLFAVYKNFTAVDKETVVKEERIEEKVKNTSGVENFVRNFAQEYFSLMPDSDFQSDRANQLSKYMSENLISLSEDMLKDIEDEVEVSNVQIWGVEPLDEENKFSVTFTVTQKTKDESTSSAYVVEVYQDGVDYVVTRLPHVSTIPTKAEHEEDYLKANDDVVVEEREKAEEFLNTFFKVYPNADENELAFYVKDENMKPIYKNYKFLSIDNLVIDSNEKGDYEVEFIVKYEDQDTNVVYSNQYRMKLTTKDSDELVITELG